MGEHPYVTHLMALPPSPPITSGPVPHPSNAAVRFVLRFCSPSNQPFCPSICQPPFCQSPRQRPPPASLSLALTAPPFCRLTQCKLPKTGRRIPPSRGCRCLQCAPSFHHIRLHTEHLALQNLLAFLGFYCTLQCLFAILCAALLWHTPYMVAVFIFAWSHGRLCKALQQSCDKQGSNGSGSNV